VDKSKLRFDQTAEELERVLVQKEGESMKETAMQGRTPGGATGKRTGMLGKSVVTKGGMLLKGKNPGNVRFRAASSFTTCSYDLCMVLPHRFSDRKMMSAHECRTHLTSTRKQ
jgi:hypothetical protein